MRLEYLSTRLGGLLDASPSTSRATRPPRETDHARFRVCTSVILDGTCAPVTRLATPSRSKHWAGCRVRTLDEPHVLLYCKARPLSTARDEFFSASDAASEVFARIRRRREGWPLMDFILSYIVMPSSCPSQSSWTVFTTCATVHPCCSCETWMCIGLQQYPRENMN